MTFPVARRMQGVQRTLIRRLFDAAPPDAINLGLGQPDLPTPPGISLAGVEAIAGGRTGYTSTAGDAELRDAIAARYEPWIRDPDQVLVTVGTQEALFVAGLALLNPGAELLVPDPGYPAYPVVARLLDARPVAYPLRPEVGFRLDPDDVLRRITRRTGAVVLCTPSNPTGACIPRETLRALGAELDRRGIPWISDEIYDGFCYDDRFTSAAELGPSRGLVISGLSKDASMAGWRVGWIVGPREVIQRMVAAHQYVVTCCSSISQRAALAALSRRGVEEREGYRRLFEHRRAVMGDELKRVQNVRWARPDGAFYYFVDVSDHGCSLAIAQRILERRNVVVIPGEAFGENGAGWLRLSFACTEERIREGVGRIVAELG